MAVPGAAWPFDDRTALVVVDMQNDFADRRGSLYVDGGEQVTEQVNRLVREARAAGATVVYTQDWHPHDTPHFVDGGGVWPRHCVQGSWGAQLVDGLAVDGPVVQKGTGGEDGYSGFSMRDPETGRVQHTALDGMLRERGIRRVVVVGLAQDVCVKETALDARRLGYATAVVTGATRPVEPAKGARALAELREAGVELA
ncbi:MAG TPA: isochorismatase family protein [Kofleriaceae bacterium]|nr:isochorismatase family protein [Kofleriaceae bacterium]